VKIRRNYILTLAAIILTPAIFMFGLSMWNRHVVAEAHRTVQRDGIRTKPAQFNFLVPYEYQERGLAILRADIKLGFTPASDVKAPVIRAINAHRATLPVIWTSNYFEFRRFPDPWGEVRATLEKHRSEIEAARVAALAGPFGFRVNASETIEMKVGHLEHIPSALRTFNLCVVSDLHDGRFDEAWTNVLAATRCLTDWKAEPTALAQATRFRMSSIVLAGLWQALQAHVWSEAQLDALDREWSNLNFFADLAEMAEFDGVYSLQAMNIVQTEFTSSNLTIRELIDEPKQIPTFLKDRAELAWYRARGFYDDQRDMLFYYRDRTFEVRRAVAANTLAEMLPLAGMTNSVPFLSRHGSFVPSFVDDDHFSLVGSGGVGLGWIGLAAEAEIRRHLILAAIALEKHRARTGTYPENLDGAALVDFADGKNLRYERVSNTRFRLYSAGLDCIDDHGNTSAPADSILTLLRKGIDMAWPSADSTP
jgi:hypothetical protein